MANQVVKIRSAEIASCMKCPLCDRLYREATTISECLHTFCKKCIYKKLSDDEDDCCPVCNTYLGCSPLEKLRSDHNKKDLREKVFPSKKSQGETSKVEPPAVETPKVETPKVEPPVVETPMVETPEVLPVRRKERSLSSLVVSTPRVSTKTPLTGRRSKVPTRKTPGKAIKKEEEDSSEDHSDSSSNTRQNSSPVEPDKETVKSVEKCEGKADLWDPLTCLVEAANRSKSSKITPVGSAEKSDLQKGAANNDRPAPKTKGKEYGQSSKVQDEKNGTEPAPVETSNPQKLRRNRRKKSAEASGESAVSPQNVMDGCAEVLRERKIPMWLSLIAYEDQDGNEPLAQIAPAYIRVKDADIPVSSLQKYLMIKLGLKSAEEVEIKCMGQPLIPTLQLNSLLELWLQTGAPTEKVPVQVGSTGKEFVMVLSYGRKVPPP